MLHVLLRHLHGRLHALLGQLLDHLQILEGYLGFMPLLIQGRNEKVLENLLVYRLPRQFPDNTW